MHPAVLGIGLVTLRTLREGALIELGGGGHCLDIIRNYIRGFRLLKEFEGFNQRLLLKYFEDSIPTEKLINTIVNQNRVLFEGITGAYKKLEITTKEIKLESATIIKLILHVQNNQATPTNKTAFVVVDNLQSSPLYITSIYLNPSSTPQQFETELLFIQRLFETLSDRRHILAGDFNASNIAWGSSKGNKRDTILYDIFSSANYIRRLYCISNQTYERR